ncbi:hypothetical protein [Micromonospora sp. NPDC023633]|uniref:hypothetical protein n=1 Tax=Micromonospora sp. NPDC023633 TaxID=3154320 RepID=UPI00340A99D4
MLLHAPPPLRYRYAVDTLVKLPVLAWQQRLAARPAHPPLSWPVSACAGAGLLAVPIVMVATLALTPVLGEDAAEFLFLVSPCGMLPAVAASCFHRRRHRPAGGARRPAPRHGSPPGWGGSASWSARWRCSCWSRPSSAGRCGPACGCWPAGRTRSPDEGTVAPAPPGGRTRALALKYGHVR